MTSQALSAAPAMTGMPSGIPVSRAACALTFPMIVPAFTNSGNMAAVMRSTCHFQSYLPTQRPFL